MEVLVNVDVIERQPSRAESGELCFDFCAHLPASGSTRGQPHPERDEIGAQSTLCVDEVGDRFRRQRRPRVRHRQVDPHAKAGHRARAFDGVGGERSAHHQARGGKNAIAVGDFDSLVDFPRETEIIRRNDQKTQAEKPPRARRKERNSIPSRKRRTIICGLRAISATIAAIFGARK